jgi:hypothetical protein
MVLVCHPSYAGGENRRTVIQVALGKSVRPYLKNN